MNFPTVEPEQACENAKNRRLARAVEPDDCYDLSLANLYGEIVESAIATEGFCRSNCRELHRSVILLTRPKPVLQRGRPAFPVVPHFPTACQLQSFPEAVPVVLAKPVDPSSHRA